MSVTSPGKKRHVWPGGLRVLLLMLADLCCMVAVWAFVVWGYRALGFGHYKYGAEFYFTLWPAGIAFIVLNALFRLYHGSVIYPSAPVNPVEELRRLTGSAILTHIGVIAALAIAYQSTEHYSRAGSVMRSYQRSMTCVLYTAFETGNLISIRNSACFYHCAA